MTADCSQEIVASVSIDNCVVRCYSGRSYADRPISFTAEGRTYDIETVEKEWLEPGRKCFQVKTSSQERFHLCYDIDQDRWNFQRIAVQAGADNGR